jgi:GntR family transcriptional regulator
MALGITDPSRQVIVRRRLAAAPDDTPVQFRVSYIPAELAEGTPIAQSTAITDAWPAALTTYLGKQVRLASSQVTARHPNHEEAAALALPSDAAVLVREDIYEDRRGSPVDFTRTVWPGDTTWLVVGG